MIGAEVGPEHVGQVEAFILTRLAAPRRIPTRLAAREPKARSTILVDLELAVDHELLDLRVVEGVESSASIRHELEVDLALLQLGEAQEHDRRVRENR